MGINNAIRTGLSRVGPAIFLVWVAAWSGCSTTLNPQRGDLASEAKTFERIVVDLATPAMQGRGVGTPGLALARDYLIRQFKALGLHPAFVRSAQQSRHEPDENAHGAYTQTFEIKLNPDVKTQTLELLDEEGAFIDAAQGRVDFNTLGFSPNQQFVGSVVFVGYGIVDVDHRYDSYQEADRNVLLGKIAVAFRYEPQTDGGKSQWADHQAPHAGRWTRAARLLNKAKWAAQRGASALLVVNPPTQEKGDLKSTRGSAGTEKSVIPVLHITSSLFEKMLKQAGFDPDVAIRDFQYRADHGQGRVTPLDGVVIRGRVELDTPKVQLSNVAGIVPGAGDLADQVVVIGAHYDHLGYGEVGSLAGQHAIHPGADDNASGTAGLMLLAKWFAGRSAEQASSHDARRTILFVAFTGEERGLIGSAYLLKHLEDLNLRPEQLVAMVNMDMIGRMKANKLYAIGTSSGDRWESLIRDAADGIGLDVDIQTKPFGGSDHTMFLHHQIPAVHFFTGAHEDYHRPSDTADKINSQSAVKILALIENLLNRICTDQALIAFNPESLGSPASRLDPKQGGGAYLGVMPDYASLEGDQGCALSIVISNSPAQTAGVRDTDVIVGWNQKPIGNVYDLTNALRQGQPGQRVRLKLLRDGNPIEVNVTLGQR